MSKSISQWINDNQTSLLVGAGLVSMVGATVTTAFAAPKANERIAEAAKKKGKPLTFFEKVKASWRCYIVPGVLTVGGGACIIAGHTQDRKAVGAAMAALTIEESWRKNYRQTIKEKLEPEKAKEVQQETARKSLERVPLIESDIIATGFGVDLCYDPFMERYYLSNAEVIKEQCRQISNDINSWDSVTLNDLFIKMGLPTAGVGERFIISNLNIPAGADPSTYKVLDPERDCLFSSELKNNRPVLVFNYEPVLEVAC